MTVTAHTYTKLAASLGAKTMNLTSDTLKVMLLSAYTPGEDTHQFVSDVKGAGTEASGTGYSAGGLTLASVTFTESGHVYTLSCTSPAWTSSSIAAAFAVFYDSTPGTDATNPVMCYWDLGGTQTSSAGTFTLTISGSGLITVTGS